MKNCKKAIWLCLFLSIEIFCSNALAAGYGKDTLKLASKPGDAFELSILYDVYNIQGCPIICFSEGYVLYYPKEMKYRKVGDTLPPDIVEYYALMTDKPNAATWDKVKVYGTNSIGLLIFLFVIGLNLHAHLGLPLYRKAQKKLSDYRKIKEAVLTYINKGGNDFHVVAMLQYLAQKRRGEIPIRFHCVNSLPSQDVLTCAETGEKIACPYAYFRPEAIGILEESILKELNKWFAQVVSNDAFVFIRSDQKKIEGPFIDIKFVVASEGNTYSSKKTGERYLGLYVDWEIGFFLNNTQQKLVKIVSNPADNLSVTVTNGQILTPKLIFEEMAKTAFSDLVAKLKSVIGNTAQGTGS